MFFGRLFFTYQLWSNAEGKQIKLQSLATTQIEDFFKFFYHKIVFNSSSIVRVINCSSIYYEIFWGHGYLLFPFHFIFNHLNNNSFRNKDKWPFWWLFSFRHSSFYFFFFFWFLTADSKKKFVFFWILSIRPISKKLVVGTRILFPQNQQLYISTEEKNCLKGFLHLPSKKPRQKLFSQNQVRGDVYAVLYKFGKYNFVALNMINLTSVIKHGMFRHRKKI